VEHVAEVVRLGRDVGPLSRVCTKTTPFCGGRPEPAGTSDQAYGQWGPRTRCPWTRGVRPNYETAMTMHVGEHAHGRQVVDEAQTLVETWCSGSSCREIVAVRIPAVGII